MFAGRNLTYSMYSFIVALTPYMNQPNNVLSTYLTLKASHNQLLGLTKPNTNSVTQAIEESTKPWISVVGTWGMYETMYETMYVWNHKIMECAVLQEIHRFEMQSFVHVSFCNSVLFY
jgi:hypothetical protein